MKKVIPALVVSLAIGCGSQQKQQPAAQAADENARFDAYKKRFIEQLWKQFPYWASSVGFHQYDSVLHAQDHLMINRELVFIQNHLDSLEGYEPKKLSANNVTDLKMMDNQLRFMQWSRTDLRLFEWDPSYHNVCGGFAEMLANNYDSLDTRLRNFSLKLRHVPAYYEAAMKTIKNPTREHTQLAIERHMGSLSTFEEDLEAAITSSGLSAEEKAILRSRAAEAVKAIKNYTGWLAKLDHKNARSFRLGKELYGPLFKYEMASQYSAEQMYQKALARKKYLHENMAKLTMELWPKYFKLRPRPQDTLLAIRQLIDEISLKHTSPDSFQVTIEKQLPELVDFIKEKDLLYIDPSKPLVVRREPAYMTGIAIVSINAPGPYDKNGNTYYNVGGLSGWEPKRQESYLREYNHYMLQILNIHEAIPGHYTQLVYSNQSPSLIKSIFGNGPMIEGWAVYTELMMLENGYGGNSPEMWLMYYKWNLRSVCNTILDYSVHTLGMSKEDVMHLLVNEAFQQQAEADGKWRRVQLSQVQLCYYFTGFTEIVDLREELKTKLGDRFSLKKFHEKFLGYGSSPVKFIRELMLQEFR